MPKIFITDQDIEALARQGVMTLSLDPETVLTDLAYEKAQRLGVHLAFHDPEKPPAAPVRPYLSPAVEKKAPTADSGASAVPEAAPQRNRLRFSAQAGEADLRAAMVETGQIAYQSGLMISNDGNISVRLANGNILITPSGVCKGRLQAEDLLVIDPEGKLVKPAADPALKPTSEQPMHLEVYRQRPDVRAVIHTHLIFANALVISKGQVRMDVIPEAAVAFGSVPVTDYAMPSSNENAAAIRSLIARHNVILIRNHGSLTVGQHLEEALIHLERLEHISKTLTFAEILGEVNPLPRELLDAIALTLAQSKG
ncbi:MAG TPA: class II aldolase/adducin family protein [Anaerolineaceae bacterium]